MSNRTVPIDSRLHWQRRRQTQKPLLALATVSGIVLAGSIAAYPLLPAIYLSMAR